MEYNWKDLLVDAEIVAIGIDVLALIVRQFTASFNKFLVFLVSAWV